MLCLVSITDYQHGFLSEEQATRLCGLAKFEVRLKGLRNKSAAGREGT